MISCAYPPMRNAQEILNLHITKIMKFINKYALLLAAITGSLASCSNDEALMEGPSKAGESVYMEVTAMRNGNQELDTRTSLYPNSGKLDCVWTAGDKILVTDETGTAKGYLTLKDGAGSAEASFEGNLYGVDGGKHTFNYYYLGTENSSKSYSDVKDVTFQLDYSLQKGTLASLNEYDVLSVAKETIVEDGKSYAGTIDFGRRVSYARFDLRLPDDVVYPIQVTLSGDKLGNHATISMTNADQVDYTKGNVVVNADSNDIYITYLPTDGEYLLTFNVKDANDAEYIGEYTVKSVIGQNVYFRKALKDEAGNTLEYVGIPVDLKHADGRDDLKWFIIRYGMWDSKQAQWVYYQHNEQIAANKYDKTILSFDEAFPEYEYDKELCELSHWTSVWNAPEPRYDVGSKYTLDFDDPSTGTITIKENTMPMIHIALYAWMMYNYTVEVELGEGVILTGAETLNSTYKTHDSSWNRTIVPDGVSVTKEGYKFVGWREKETGNLITNNTVYLNSNKIKATLVPEWKEYHGVETGGYVGGTLN